VPDMGSVPDVAQKCDDVTEDCSSKCPESVNDIRVSHAFYSIISF